MNIICDRILPYLDRKSVIELGNMDLVCKYVLVTFTLDDQERSYIIERKCLPVFVAYRFWKSDALIRVLQSNCILQEHIKYKLLHLLQSGTGDISLFKKCFNFLNARIHFFEYDYNVCRDVLSVEPFRFKQYTVKFTDRIEIFFGDIRIGVGKGVGVNGIGFFVMFEHMDMNEIVNILKKNGSISLIHLYNKTIQYKNASPHKHVVYRRPKIGRR